jgi:phosphoglycolate phosphatase
VSEYEAIVYDLDGTLVRLDVDWDAVAARCGAVLRARDVEAAGASIWEMRERAAENDLLERVDETIAEFEREGARSASRLPLADELPRDEAVGVCSLNASAACRIALELHGLDGHVGTVVGRDSVETVKPDPEPLLAAVEALGATPERTLFIGDSDTDEIAAQRAGTEFEWVADRV